MTRKITLLTGLLLILLSACQAAAQPGSQALRVLAVESFLADMAQNVAGDRVQVEALVPLGMDPHTYEPTPQDVVRIANARLLLINGAGLEAWLERTLQAAGSPTMVVEASAGLSPRETHTDEHAAGDDHAGEVDPHFWLDPVNARQYVINLRDGLIAVDAAGTDEYRRNAEDYLRQLDDLHTWILQQMETLPPERRMLVTNHESFGYFADRYGFKIIGSLLPGVSTGSTPSAQQLARLVDQIRASGTPAIFLEGGASPQLGEQVAREAGVTLVTGLLTHSLTPPGEGASTYIDMIKHNVLKIVSALAP